MSTTRNLKPMLQGNSSARNCVAEKTPFVSTVVIPPAPGLAQVPALAPVPAPKPEPAPAPVLVPVSAPVAAAPAVPAPVVAAPVVPAPEVAPAHHARVHNAAAVAVVVPSPKAGELSEQLLELKSMFPQITTSELRKTLTEAKNDVAAAATTLLAAAESSPPTPSPPATPLAKLANVFPSTPRPQLERVLLRTANDLDKAVALLLAPDGGGSDGGDGGKDKEPPAPEKRRLYHPPPLRPAAKAPRWSSAIHAHGGAAAVVVKINRALPSQSLSGLKDDPVLRIQSALAPLGDKAQFVAYCFQTMIEREQELYDNWYVFYHSYSFALLLYEVQAELARTMYELPEDFAPLPRLLHSPFHGKPTLEMLMDEFKSMHGQDHDPRFRALAISVSCSLFAPGSEAPPISCFCSGYSCSDLSFRGLLTGLLKTCKVEDPETLTDRIIEVGNKFHLPTAPFVSRPAAPYGLFAGVGGGGELAPGSMLQIFVHKDFVDSIAYASQPMGVPVKGVKVLSKHLDEGHSEGQARLFMHPAVFVDPSKARLYHYSANPLLCSMDTTLDGTRGKFVQDLRRALAPILGNYHNLKQAFKAIEGHD
eukprot:TRINITY_DN3511_c0_g1_i6.p1 TRINITY_DN3511_c0_g1~~TRINITY_DN3511_c0_g1_i6.p1  ORF type:complete len:591 (+),score=130.17 TRINITY_DN3511_c0_g1_i6:364-2136(+)